MVSTFDLISKVRAIAQYQLLADNNVLKWDAIQSFEFLVLDGDGLALLVGLFVVLNYMQRTGLKAAYCVIASPFVPMGPTSGQIYSQENKHCLKGYITKVFFKYSIVT